MHGPEEDHQEDHLEEHQEDVALGKQQRHDGQNRAGGALQNRQPQRVQSFFHALFWPAASRRHVNVAYVSGEVDREADAHDQVDHGDGVEIHVPQRHVADDAHLDRDYAERDPDRAEEVRNENEGNDHHDDGANHHALDGRRPHQLELIEEHEVRMENRDVYRRVLANVAQILHHLLLVVRVGDVDGLDQEPRRLDARLVFIKCHIEGKWISGVQPVLKLRLNKKIVRKIE